MVRAKKRPKKPEVHLHTITLTAAVAEALESLSGTVSDYTGRQCSKSALIRALVRLAYQQETKWLYEKVCPFVEAEVQEGLLWGSKKKVSS
jgi:hypothetical protein